MFIFNQTALELTTVKSQILVRVVYDQSEVFTLNKPKTYLKPFTYSRPVSYNVSVQGMSEDEIRASRLICDNQTYSAINGQSFWNYLKCHFKLNKQPPQNEARFSIPSIDLNHTLVLHQTNGTQTLMIFEPLPWQVSLIKQLDSITLNPTIIGLDYDPRLQSAEVTLAYEVDSNEKRDSVLVEYLNS